MHQISAGSERAIVAHWINNHCSLVHVPPCERGSPAVSLCTLVPGQHQKFLPSLMFCSHSRLAALPSPSQHCPALGRNCTGGFMGSQLHLPTMACSNALPWAKGSYPSPKNLPGYVPLSSKASFPHSPRSGKYSCSEQC